VRRDEAGTARSVGRSKEQGEVAEEQLEASIVIPVYNDAATLGTLLVSLQDDATRLGCRIVVVCNGCTDDSASVARAFPGVMVAELDEASKSSALNLGDELAGDTLPRLYADADIVFESSALDVLLDELGSDAPVAVGPEVRFITDGASWPVRGYYYGLVTLPRRAAWRSRHLTGRGLYGANRTARARFGRFPQLRADDAYFDAQFTPAERRVVQDAVVDIHVPATTHELVRNIARVTAANRELDAWLGRTAPEPVSQVDRRGLAGRVQRTVEVWRASPLVADFDGLTTISLLAGFAVVRALAPCYRGWLALSSRQVRWR
jgi:glycosyltransferase involved in cell wall biosynthesis